MKKFLSLFVIVLFSLSASAETISNPLLWKAEKDGKIVYLFGTFHLGFTINDLPATFKPYIDNSTNFFMEADTSKVDPAKLGALGSFPKGQSLDQFLPAESWTKLVTLLSPFMPEENLKTLKPWYVMTGLVTAIVIQQLGLEGTLDTDLLQYAQSKSKTLGYLETAAVQFSVIEAITPSSVLDADLKKPGNLIENAKTEMLALYGCYKTSDVGCLTKTLGSKGNGGSLENWQLDLILKQRNKTWIPVIEKSLTTGPSFVAVGAGHLVGQGSVLELLKNEGYTVERVKF